MASNLRFPLSSSFRVLSVRTGSLAVGVSDGAVSATRLLLVLVNVELVKKEHYFTNMSLYASRIRYTVLFTMNTLACLLLVVAILTRERRPLPVLMLPWLVSFLCCTWLYYPNIIYHTNHPGLIILCVAVMGLCLYCWSVVLSHFLDVLEVATTRRPRSDTAHDTQPRTGDPTA